MRNLLAIFALTAGLASGNWVVFSINPRNAIVTIDSAQVHNVKRGVLQLMLPFGKHTFTCESPFYRKMSDSLEVNDSVKTYVNVDLQPEISYIVVVNPLKGADVYLDGEKMGKSKTVTCPLTAGSHRVNVIKDGMCWYDGTVILEKGEKKTVVLDAENLSPVPLISVPELRIPGLETSADDCTPAEEKLENMKAECGGVNVHTDIPGAVILINGCEVGITPAIVGNLYPGVKYRVTARREGYKDASKYVEVQTGKVLDLDMKMKKKH